MEYSLDFEAEVDSDQSELYKQSKVWHSAFQGRQIRFKVRDVRKLLIEAMKVVDCPH